MSRTWTPGILCLLMMACETHTTVGAIDTR